jgi:hypothetical protein
VAWSGNGSGSVKRKAPAGVMLVTAHGNQRFDPRRFADAFGVVGVVLLALDIRLDELRRNQADRVPHPLKYPARCALAHASLPIRLGASFSKNFST